MWPEKSKICLLDPLQKKFDHPEGSQVVYLLKLEDIFALKKAFKKEKKKGKLKRNATPKLL